MNWQILNKRKPLFFWKKYEFKIKISLFLPGILLSLPTFAFLVGSSPVSVQKLPLKLVPEITIAQESGDINLMFGAISYIDIDSAGNIFIVDYKNRQVKIFDREGRFLRKIDIPAGQGPRELNQISGLAVTPSGTLFLNGDRKMIIYDSQGNHLRTFKVDFHVSCIRSAGAEEVIGIGPHNGNILHVFDSEGRLISSFGEILDVPKDFEPMRMMPMFGAPLIFSASKDGRIFILNPHRYEILIFRNQKLEQRMEASSELYEPLTQKGRGFLSTAAEILPAGKYLLIYFESYRNEDNLADVFIKGKKVGSIKLPGQLKAVDYQGKLYIVSQDEFPKVTRYSISE